MTMFRDAQRLPMASQDAEFLERATGPKKGKKKDVRDMTDKEKKHRATVAHAIRVLDAMKKEQRRPMRGLLQKNVHRRKMQMAPLMQKKPMPGKPMMPPPDSEDMGGY